MSNAITTRGLSVRGTSASDEVNDFRLIQVLLQAMGKAVLARSADNLIAFYLETFAALFYCSYANRLFGKWAANAPEISR